MSLQALQERLTTLQENAASLRELMERLAHTGSEPDAIPPDADVDAEDGSIEELSGEINSLLRGSIEEEELLLEELKFARPEGGDKARLMEGVDRLGSELTAFQGIFRKARISVKRNLERARRQDRERMAQSLLLAASRASSPASDSFAEAAAPRISRVARASRPHQRQRQQHQSSLTEADQQTVGANSSVTDALRRTHDLIATELSRSEFAQQTLTESSAALKQLGKSYTSLDTVLASSRDLLGTLLRSQKSDTWYLQTALYVLVVTAAWLVFRRFLYGPLWWLVWLPLRLLFGIGMKAGSVVTQHQGGNLKRSALSSATMAYGVPVKGLPDHDLPTAQVERDGDHQSNISETALVADVTGTSGDDLGGKGSSSQTATVAESPTVDALQEVSGAGAERDEL